MKKIFLTCLIMAGLTFDICAQSCNNDIFFSEYLEGASNNKAIEVFNNHYDTINLADYVIYRFNNGSPNATDSLLMQGMLAPGDVYVAGNPSAVANILAVSDTLHTITFFNGDDAMMLKNRITGDTLDIIGIIGNDPGTNWPCNTGATSEYTLVRSLDMCHGEKTWSVAATRWDVYPQNTFTYLGAHSMGTYGTSDSVYICLGDAIFAGGAWQTNPGVYNDIFCGINGCDSVVTTTLVLNSVDTLVHVQGDSLVANGSSAFYSWIDCSSGIPVAGADDSIFLAPSTGYYALSLFQNSCYDTSACHYVERDAPINISLCAGDLFFSEYIEGTSNNKAIELFNPTTSAINLSNYTIYRFNNGSNTPSDSLFPIGLLFPGDVYVAANPSGDQILIDESDYLHTIAFFTGDDALVLVNKLTGDTLDIIGIIGNDPGTNWTVGSGATSEYTLVRSSTICQGTTNWTLSAMQWNVYPQNTFGYLGSHMMTNLTGFDNLNICEGDSVFLAGSWQTLPGLYFDTLCTVNGCDSLLTTNLNFINVDTSVVFNGDSLWANASATSYQWMNCTGGILIPGAINQSFTPIFNGFYAVIATVNGCIDTSACHPYFSVGLEKNAIHTLNVQPNPTTGEIILENNGPVGSYNYSLYAVTGKQLFPETYTDKVNTIIDLSGYDKGLYLIHILYGNENLWIKVIRM